MIARLRTDIIMGLLTSSALLLSVLLLLTTEVYALSPVTVATFDEIDEDHEPLISEILNQLINHTADKIVIDGEAGRMIISWSNASEIMNDGRLGSGEITVSTPHNFTIRNGYEYRDGTIYKPDGTELFSD
jgi:hypothetical protein